MSYRVCLNLHVSLKCLHSSFIFEFLSIIHYNFISSEVFFALKYHYWLPASKIQYCSGSGIKISRIVESGWRFKTDVFYTAASPLAAFVSFNSKEHRLYPKGSLVDLPCLFLSLDWGQEESKLSSVGPGGEIFVSLLETKSLCTSRTKTYNGLTGKVCWSLHL